MYSKSVATISERSRQGVLVLLGILLLASARPTLANRVTVGCAGAPGGSYDYTTIGAALDALRAISLHDHQITVSGKCRELVYINDFVNLSLTGSPSAVPTVLADPAAGASPILQIYHAQYVQVTGFLIQGSGASTLDLVRVFDDSLVTFDRCIIQGSGGMGLFVNDSNVWLRGGSKVQDNQDAGIRAANSTLSLGSVSSEATSTIVQRNQTGIQVDENGLARIWGATIIQQNREAGVAATGARVIMCCEAGERKIIDNGGDGISVGSGSVWMWGGVLIQGNQANGISLLAGSATVMGWGGAQTVQNNRGTGIVARGNSHLELYKGLVTGNSGTGIVLQDNSSVTVYETAITGNTGGGVVVFALSTAAMWALNNISGNGGNDFSCGGNSYAYGDKSGIGKMDCPAFNQ